MQFLFYFKSKYRFGYLPEIHFQKQSQGLYLTIPTSSESETAGLFSLFVSWSCLFVSDIGDFVCLFVFVSTKEGLGHICQGVTIYLIFQMYDFYIKVVYFIQYKSCYCCSFYISEGFEELLFYISPRQTCFCKDYLAQCFDPTCCTVFVPPFFFLILSTYSQYLFWNDSLPSNILTW